MFEYKTGDILAADADALVNTVNCVGVMGRGIALQFKNAFPENFRAYEQACKRDEVRPGHMFVFETGQLTSPRYIINFPTKRHWRGKSRMEDIDAGLKDLQRVIREKKIRSIAIPRLAVGWAVSTGMRSGQGSRRRCAASTTCKSSSSSRMAHRNRPGWQGGRRRRT